MVLTVLMVNKIKDENIESGNLSKDNHLQKTYKQNLQKIQVQ